MKKILCVVTSNNVKGATGIPTGFWLGELTHPLEKFSAAGFDYVLASIKGGSLPLTRTASTSTTRLTKNFGTTKIFNASSKIL